jgi:VWFA-related protein
MNNLRRILAASVSSALLFVSPLLAQNQSAPATTLKVNVQVVTMSVTVRDKQGAIVPNLTKNDFDLSEDGRPQTVKYFAHDPNLPLTLGLLVDTSMSQRNVLDAERTASQQFLDQMLTGAHDRAFLIQFAHEVDLLVDPSSDKAKLRNAVDQIGAPQFSNTGDTQSGGDSSDGHRMGGGGTMLYDAIYLASDELMKKQPDRKALVILTDGVDRGSKESLFSAIEAAQRANTVVYAIYFKGEESGHDNSGSPGHHHGGMGYPGGGYPGGGYPGGGGGYPNGGGGWPGGGGGGRSGRPTEGSRVDGKKVLEQICGETGGRMYEVDKKNSVDQIYTAIAEELRAQYMLGYTPDKQSTGYHKIALIPKKKDLFVQTRQGYYAGE